MEPELGARKVAVLRAVVEEYVRTGEPVGSETIAEGANLGVSSATIRNEMAALEELGYLSHPHTSAGRIPTDAGYRRFVDSLPPGGRIRDAQRRAIAGFFAETMQDLEEVLRGTTQLLSRVTQYAGLAVPPTGSSNEVVLRTELIEVGSGVLLLIVGQQGRVDKLMIERPDDLDAEGLATLDRALADKFHGRDLGEAQTEALKAAAGAGKAERAILAAAAELFGDMQLGAGAQHVMIGGVANLADEAAHWRRETVRRLFEALEHESEMLELLRDVTTEDMNVTIGAEHPHTGEWEASIVSAPFHAGLTALGTVGVVGPTAMDYVNVMASVRDVARRLSELATELGA
jgi:heat-inducible transcriptional repressor